MPPNIAPLQQAYQQVQQAPKAYDLGGGEAPVDEGQKANSIWTVVDMISEKKFRGYGFKNPYIQANLNKPVQLQPVKRIHTSAMVKYIKNLGVLADTIAAALLPGGRISISDTYVNSWVADLRLVHLLTTVKGFKVVSDGLRDTLKEPAVIAVLKKFGVNDLVNLSDLTPEKADNIDNAYDEGTSDISLSEYFEIVLRK